jgi:hypothetical protein
VLLSLDVVVAGEEKKYMKVAGGHEIVVETIPGAGGEVVLIFADVP